MTKIVVLYYSLYGSTFELAREVGEGASAAGAEVRLRRAPETIPAAVWQALPGVLDAKRAQQGVPEATMADLEWADGFCFGSPTRFGNMSGQMKNFLDQTGSLWMKGALDGRPVGFFTGASTMHGGHESTILTMSTFAFHFGMVIVPLGFVPRGPGTTTTGGGPYGPSHWSPMGGQPRCVDEDEKEMGRELGRRVTRVARSLTRDRTDTTRNPDS